MGPITIGELILQIENIDESLNIQPRKEVAKILGLDVRKVTRNTIFILSGRYKEGLPNFIRFSPYLEQGTGVMVNEPIHRLNTF